MVVEDLGFEPDGEGEHIWCILKNGCNTALADALAKFLKIHAREVSFAGRKTNTRSEQWLCARVPGNAMPDLNKFELEGCKVLEYARHKRKTASGGVEGNNFTLVLREVTDRDDVEKRLQAINERGVLTILAHSVLASAAVTCRAHCAGRRAMRRCVTGINAVFGCRRPAVRCLIRIVSERLKKPDANQVVVGVRYNWRDAVAGLWQRPKKWPMYSRAWTLKR